MALSVQPVGKSGKSLFYSNPEWDDEIVMINLEERIVQFKFGIPELKDLEESSEEEDQEAISLLSRVGGLFASPPSF